MTKPSSLARLALPGALFLSLASCGLGRHSPSETRDCADVAGSYDGSFYAFNVAK